MMIIMIIKKVKKKKSNYHQYGPLNNSSVYLFVILSTALITETGMQSMHFRVNGIFSFTKQIGPVGPEVLHMRSYL